MLAAGALTLAFGPVGAARAEVMEVVESLSAPAKVETGIGTLEFRDGVPTEETTRRAFDAADFANALAVYNNSFRGTSAYAMRQSLHNIGAEDNAVVIFSDLMDASALFLTANDDTIYYMSAIDLSGGPIVIEQPSDAIGTINDMWFSWAVDIGGPGPVTC